MNWLKTHIIVVVMVLLGATAVAPMHLHGQGLDGIQLIESVIDQLDDPSTIPASGGAGFSRQGVYGCTGGSYGSVGMQGPGGPHVPVFDDAIHDQQRLLTYKECLLDGIVNSMRETLVSFIVKSVITWTNAGLEGNPAYVTNLPLHMLENISDPEAERVITGVETEALPESFRRNVRVTLAKYYANATRRPQSEFRCGLPNEQLDSFTNNNDFYGGGGWESFYKLTTNSSCNPLFAYHAAEQRLNEALAAEQVRERTQLDWGSGFRTIERDRQVNLGEGDSRTLQRIVTPGFMISEHLRHVLGTGIRQSENADEIDEIISALMANIGTEMLTDFQGLSGLTRTFGGSTPYTDRLASNAAARTRSNLVGVALTVVNNTSRVENEYVQTRRASATVLARAQAQLETWERTCWASMVSQARTDLAQQVESQACSAAGSTSTPCGISVSVSESVATDALAITVPREGRISVAGRATEAGSRIDLVVRSSAGDTPTPPLTPTVTTTGEWQSSTIDLSEVPDGTLSVRATETRAGGGALTPVTENIQKATTPIGIEIILPVTLPARTITATAGRFTVSATIPVSTARSRSIANQNITPLLALVREHILLGNRALQVLSQLQEALSNTSSASAQRFLLERFDQLIAAGVLHTESELRSAREQTLDIEGAMEQLLEETKENWENGWCQPANWQQYTT